MEKKNLPPSLQSSSVENYIPGSASRNKSFQYHVHFSTDQNQPSRAPLKSALKKSTVHNSVESSSDKEDIVPSPIDFTEPELTGIGEGKPAECNTTKICAEPRVMLSVSTDRIIRKSSLGTRSAARPQLLFVTEPSDFEGVADVPVKQGCKLPTRGMRTRFAAAKKRKLFNSSAHD
jgi:hypothetical protein